MSDQERDRLLIQATSDTIVLRAMLRVVTIELCKLDPKDETRQRITTVYEALKRTLPSPGVGGFAALFRNPERVRKIKELSLETLDVEIKALLGNGGDLPPNLGPPPE